MTTHLPAKGLRKGDCSIIAGVDTTILSARLKVLRMNGPMTGSMRRWAMISECQWTISAVRRGNQRLTARSASGKGA